MSGKDEEKPLLNKFDTKDRKAVEDDSVHEFLNVYLAQKGSWL